MKEVLTIGFVATAISPYFSEEQQVRIKSENHLKKIIAEYDAKLICFHKTIFSKEDSVEAEKFFKNKIDFLIKSNLFELKYMLEDFANKHSYDLNKINILTS